MSFNFPQIPDRECELLGLILVNPPSINEIIDRVPENAFLNDLTRAIWSEMVSLTKGGTRVSIPLLRERVKVDSAKFNIPDLASFLATCMDRVEGDVSLSDLAELMANQAMLSDLSKTLREAQERIAKGQGTAEEVAATSKAAIDRLLNSVRASDTMSLSEAAQSFASGVAESFSSGKPVGQDWGLRPLNDCVGMIEDGDAIVLAGPSGHGKSSLLVQIMMHIAKRRPVFLIQREMRPQAIAGREVMARTGVSNSVIESGGMQQSEVEAVLDAASKLNGIPFEICYLADMKVSRIRTRLQAFLHRHGDCGFCAIDTVKHVDPEDKGARSDVDRIVSSAMQLQQMAAETNVATCMVAQVKVQYFDKISPDIQIHDIYGGGGLREVADTVFLIHQPAMKMHSLALVSAADKDRSMQIVENWEGYGQIKCVKRRRGRPGMGRLKWDGPKTRFSDPDDDDQEDML